MPYFISYPTQGTIRQSPVDANSLSVNLRAIEQIPVLEGDGIGGSGGYITQTSVVVTKPMIQKATVWTGLYATGPLDVLRQRLLYLDQGTLLQNISLGLVTQDTELNLSIWNGHVKNTTITQVDITSGQGILVTGVGVGAPMNALEELPLNITVLGSGPSSFDALITIRLGVNSDTYTLRITGVRISVPFLLDAEWASGLSVSRKYLTAVTVGSTMAESRMSMRANPTRSIEAPLFFGSTDSAMQAYASLRAASTSSFLMPYVPDRTEMTAPQTGHTLYLSLIHI